MLFRNQYEPCGLRRKKSSSGRHWIGEIKGGGNTERAPKHVFCAIPYFLEITDVGEAYLIYEIISVLLKVYSTNRPHRLKTQMFCQSKHI
jgi:hypothetical protein